MVQARSPLVSVVIPTRNRRLYACVAIRSVLRQTYHNLEVILVDDASSDGTADVVRAQFGELARVIECTSNVERGAARNLGAAAGTGEFVAFLDSDDVWTRTKLERQLADAAPGANVTGLFVINHESRPTGRSYLPPPNAQDDVFVRNPYLGAPSSLLINRQVFLGMGGFPEEWNVQGSEDWVFLAALQASGVPINVVAEELIGYRVHKSNSTGATQSVAQSMCEASRVMARSWPVHSSVRRDVEIASLLVQKYAAEHDLRAVRRWLSVVRKRGERREMVASMAWAAASAAARRPLAWPPALPYALSPGYGWIRSSVPPQTRRGRLNRLRGLVR